MQKSILVILLLFIISINCYTQYIPSPSGYGPGYFVKIPRKNIGYSDLKSYDYVYDILLDNDSLISLKTHIEFDETGSFIKYKSNNKKIILRPIDTKSIRCINDGRNMLGLPHNNRWLFLIIKGKINVFATMPETGEKYLTHMRMGNDGITKKYTKENVIAMVAECETAAKLAKKGKLYKAILEYNLK